jgi:hypothetical protein
VSPAVRDYLGLGAMDVTDWQFVEVRDVPPGPWRDYGDNNHFVIARRQAEERLRQGASSQRFKFGCTVIPECNSSVFANIQRSLFDLLSNLCPACRETVWPQTLPLTKQLTEQMPNADEPPCSASVIDRVANLVPRLVGHKLGHSGEQGLWSPTLFVHRTESGTIFCLHAG